MLGLLIVFEENMSDTCICYVDIICVYVSECTFKVVPVVLASLAVAAYHLAFLHFFVSALLPSVTLMCFCSSMQSMHVGVHISLICVCRAHDCNCYSGISQLACIQVSSLKVLLPL